MDSFALKFLEWWYQSDFGKQLSRKAAENIQLPPPVLSSLLGKGDGALKKKAAKDAEALAKTGEKTDQKTDEKVMTDADSGAAKSQRKSDEA